MHLVALSAPDMGLYAIYSADRCGRIGIEESERKSARFRLILHDSFDLILHK